MKLLSILIIALASSYSFAEMAHKEALGQAAAGMNRINLGYSYTSFGTQEEESPSAESTINTNRIVLNYERGLNKMFVLGAGLDYTGVNTDTAGDKAFDTNGLEHISVFFKGIYNMGAGGLYYGLNVDFGLGDTEIEFSSLGNRSGNTSTGSLDFTPYLAYGMNHGSFAWGVRVDYTVRGEQSIEVETPAGTTDGELEDGNTLKLSAFYERDLSDKSLFGLGISHTMTEFQTDESDADFGRELDVTAIDIYGAINFCKCEKSGTGMTFLPKLSYLIASGEEANDTDLESTGGSYAVEFTVRKEF